MLASSLGALAVIEAARLGQGRDTMAMVVWVGGKGRRWNHEQWWEDEGAQAYL